MKSMTGYGAGEYPCLGGRAVVEIRTVNSRALDVRVRLPRELGDTALWVEQAVRARLGRGRCEVTARLEGVVSAPLRLDEARAQAALGAFRALRDAHFPGTELSLSLLTSVPDLFVSAPEGEIGASRESIQRALGVALDGLDGSRAREGEALGQDMAARARALGVLVDTIEARLPEVVAGHRKRLGERLRQLAAGLEVTIDGARIEPDIVAYVDRADVSEELTRLRAHLGLLGELLGEPTPAAEAGRGRREGEAGGPVGRKLEFLLQEVGRELNTLGAKTQDAKVSHLIVEAKTELERLKEQAQNVE
jgi:uncharacterized protein (TIGR00255 family)